MTKKKAEAPAHTIVQCMSCRNASVKTFANGDPPVATCSLTGIKEVARAPRVCKWFK